MASIEFSIDREQLRAAHESMTAAHLLAGGHVYEDVPGLGLVCRICGKNGVTDEERMIDDLRAKLAAAQAELDELRIRAGLAGQGWQRLTEDDEPVTCRCADFSCNTEAWIADGALTLEDADGMRVTFWLGPDYAFVKRTGATNATT